MKASKCACSSYATLGVMESGTVNGLITQTSGRRSCVWCVAHQSRTTGTSLYPSTTTGRSTASRVCAWSRIQLCITIRRSCTILIEPIMQLRNTRLFTSLTSRAQLTQTLALWAYSYPSRVIVSAITGTQIFLEDSSLHSSTFCCSKNQENLSLLALDLTSISRFKLKILIWLQALIGSWLILSGPNKPIWTQRTKKSLLMFTHLSRWIFRKCTNLRALACSYSAWNLQHEPLAKKSSVCTI